MRPYCCVVRLIGSYKKKEEKEEAMKPFFFVLDNDGIKIKPLQQLGNEEIQNLTRNEQISIDSRLDVVLATHTISNVLCVHSNLDFLLASIFVRSAHSRI